MIIVLANGQPLRGDLIQSATLRNDLAPIPESLEADIKYLAELEKYLEEGCIIEVAGTQYRIIKRLLPSTPILQQEKPTATISIIAVLDSVHSLCFVRRTAVIKYNTELSALYRACGAQLSGLDNDFTGHAFCCLAGDVPTYQFTRLLQEEGGVIRYKKGRLAFIRLIDLMRQEGKETLPAHNTEAIKSGFLERHQIPSFISTDESGSVVIGNTNKERTLRYSPAKNAMKLHNMTRALVRTHTTQLQFSANYYAGDVVRLSTGQNKIIITAAHHYSPNNQYTRLWLGEVQQ